MNPDVPDKTLAELDDEEEVEARDELAEDIELLKDAKYELSYLIEWFEEVQNDNMTLREVAEEIEALEEKQGGRLALDEW